jgi:hypothetical protein
VKDLSRDDSLGEVFQDQGVPSTTHLRSPANADAQDDKTLERGGPLSV